MFKRLSLSTAVHALAEVIAPHIRSRDEQLRDAWDALEGWYKQHGFEWALVDAQLRSRTAHTLSDEDNRMCTCACVHACVDQWCRADDMVQSIAAFRW